MTADFSALPQAQSCRLIDFEEVEVRPAFVQDTYVLIVAGMKPYLNMEVELRPLSYKSQPEYWEIEVVGCLRGIGLPATAPYHISIPLDGIRGMSGEEVVGASKRKKLSLRP
jgi:hypothetical protein